MSPKELGCCQSVKLRERLSAPTGDERKPLTIVYDIRCSATAAKYVCLCTVRKTFSQESDPLIRCNITNFKHISPLDLVLCCIQCSPSEVWSGTGFKQNLLR